MRKVIVLFLLVLSCQYAYSQNFRIRKNEIRFFYFTLYDFDKFPILNSQKSPVPINSGRGFSLERIIFKNYFLVFNHYTALVWMSPDKYLNGHLPYGVIYSKAYFFDDFGIGKSIIDKKLYRVKVSSQFEFRQGSLRCLASNHDIIQTYFYRDLGLNFSAEAQFKVSRFLAISVNSSYAHYFFIKDHSLGLYSFKPVVSHNSVKVNLGLSFLF